MDTLRKITFKYIFSDDYNPVYCNGVCGGISPSGEIIANFFLERIPIPNSTTNSINEDGSLGGCISKDPEDMDISMVRFISSGIVMNVDAAKSIYKWLGEQIQELENRQAID